MDLLTAIVLMIVVFSAQGLTTKTESTGIVYINTTKTDLQGAHGAMPDLLNITVEPPGPGAAEELELKKSAIDINAPVFVICGDGRSICRQKLDNIQDFALYQDSARNAAISVTKEPRSDGTKRVKMEGSILLKDVQYSLEDPGEGPGEDPHGNLTASVPYRLQRVHIEDAGTADFKILDQPMEYEKLKGRFRRQADGYYGVELLPVIDYKIYDTWYKRSKVSNPLLRDMDTKNNIRKYFAHVVNGMDLRYRGIQANDFQIYIKLAGYVIADKPNSSPWTTGNGNSGEVDADRALDRFFVWRRGARGLPVHDHATLFTGQDLYTLSNQREKMLSVTGYAYLGRICNELSVSIVEDRGGFGCVKTATHELGHSLGANHDGDKNSCMTSDQYIMAGSSVPTNDNNKLNPWKFSPCSIQAFRAKLQSLDRFAGNCLSNQALTANPREWDAHLSRHPGQLYAPDDICVQVLGPSSYMCRDLLPSDPDVCTSLWCHINGTNQCRQYVPPRGTTCGSQKWCLEGVCTVDGRAPIVRGGCTFGDQPGVAYQGETCAQIVASKPRYCYESFIRQRCCQACSRVYTSVQGCEYGDRQGRCEKWWCTLTNQDAATVRRQCCQTCNVGRRLPTTRPTTLVPPIDTKDIGVDGRTTRSPVPSGCKDTRADCSLDLTRMRVNVCYTRDFYAQCCRACVEVRQEIPGCEYGNRDPDLCSTISAPEQCRRPEINAACCRECSAFQVPENQTGGGGPGPRTPAPALLLLSALVGAWVWITR